MRGTVATLRLTRGMGGALFPQSSVDGDSSHRAAWMGRELAHGWVEEHAKGGVGLLGKSWCAGFGCLELAVGAKSRSLARLESFAGSRGLAGLSDPAKREPA